MTSIKHIVPNTSVTVDSDRINTGKNIDLDLIAKRFNVTRFPDYYNVPRPQVGHVFMTKPDLNLNDENIMRDDMMAAFRVMPGWPIYKDLLTGGKGFIPLVYNRAVSYQVKSFNLNVTEKGLTYFGSSIHYGKHSSERLKATNFTIEFYNDEYFSTLILFAIWARYIFLLSRGRIEPHNKYEVSAQLDYAVSIYYVDTQIDRKSIMYWQKDVGIFPTGIPFDVFSMEELPKVTDRISIDFECSLPDDPYSLSAIEELRKMTNPTNVDFSSPIYGNSHRSTFVGAFMADMPTITSIINTDPKAPGPAKWRLGWK